MPQFFDETKERLISKVEDVSRTLVYEATHFRSSAKRRWRSAITRKRRFKRKLKELLRIADTGDPEYNDIVYKSPEELQAIAYGRMRDLRCGFPPLFPDEIYANPNSIRSPFTQYPPSSLTTPESIFNRLYCGEPCPSHPPNMRYSPSGNWLFNPYMKNFRQELICPKPKVKHQKSNSHNAKNQKSASHKPKAKPNNAVHDNRQRPKPSAQDLDRYHKPKPAPIDSISGHKSKSMSSSIESSAKRSFESFKSVVTAETDATQVSSKTGSKKENFNVAAAKVVSQIEIGEEPVKKDVAKVNNINNIPATIGTVAKVEISGELVQEKAPKHDPKSVHQKFTKVEATTLDSTKVEATNAASSKLAISKLIIADKTAILEAKSVRETGSSTKRSNEIRVDVDKEIAKVKCVSKVAELKPKPKVERNNSQKFGDLLQEIDCMMIVQGADEYVLSRSECQKANSKNTENSKNTPKDIEKIPELTNDLSSKKLDADARTQRFNNHRAKYFADRERKIVNHKKRGYAPGSLFRISHGKYLRDVYERQMEIVGLDSSVKDFLAKKLQEELKTAQILERELTKSELEGLLEKISLCKNDFNRGVHPQVIKDDGSRVLFRSPLASLYCNNKEYQEFDQWLSFEIEESALHSS